jgi:hypothetical protein
VALAGCYAPALRDCTVSCASPHDCASGQACGDDGLCASPEAAGRCTPPPDAGPERDAELPRDAGASGDAAATIPLRVRITGVGSVVVDGHRTCSSTSPQRGDCTYDVVLRAAQIARALPIQADQQFTSWTSVTCLGMGATCAVTPVAPTTIVARFDHVSGG